MLMTKQTSFHFCGRVMVRSSHSAHCVWLRFTSTRTQHDCDANNALLSSKVRQCIARAELYISFPLLSSTPQDNERISNYTVNQASMATQHESAIWGWQHLNRHSFFTVVSLSCWNTSFSCNLLLWKRLLCGMLYLHKGHVNALSYLNRISTIPASKGAQRKSQQRAILTHFWGFSFVINVLQL